MSIISFYEYINYTNVLTVRWLLYSIQESLFFRPYSHRYARYEHVGMEYYFQDITNQNSAYSFSTLFHAAGTAVQCEAMQCKKLLERKVTFWAQSYAPLITNPMFWPRSTCAADPNAFQGPICPPQFHLYPPPPYSNPCPFQFYWHTATIQLCHISPILYFSRNFGLISSISAQSCIFHGNTFHRLRGYTPYEVGLKVQSHKKYIHGNSHVPQNVESIKKSTSSTLKLLKMSLLDIHLKNENIWNDYSLIP